MLMVKALWIYWNLGEICFSEKMGTCTQLAKHFKFFFNKSSTCLNVFWWIWFAKLAFVKLLSKCSNNIFLSKIHFLCNTLKPDHSPSWVTLLRPGECWDLPEVRECPGWSGKGGSHRTDLRPTSQRSSASTSRSPVGRHSPTKMRGSVSNSQSREIRKYQAIIFFFFTLFCFISAKKIINKIIHLIPNAYRRT